MATEPSYYEPKGERGAVVQQNAGRRAQVGSVQANYLKRLEKGVLTPEEVEQARAFAADMGWQFSVDRGYSPGVGGGVPQGGGAAPQGAGGGGIAADLGGPGGMGLTARDTATARGRTQTSVNVPRDVRAIQAGGGPRNEAQAGRMADFWGSTAGQRILQAGQGGEVGSGAGGGMPPESGQEKAFAPSLAGGGDYAKAMGKAVGNKVDQDREARGDFSNEELAERAMARDSNLTAEKVAKIMAESEARIAAARKRRASGMLASESPGGQEEVRKFVANLSASAI